ncbi:MAG: protein kinase [Planctomycetia bacterium]|nr:protein kinase [Planctomycetia bacterium]
MLASSRMNEPASLPSSSRLEAAVVEFHEQLERGQEPDRAELLRAYCDVADELAEFFADHDRMNNLAPPAPPMNLTEQTAIHEPDTPRSTDATWRSAPIINAPNSFRIGEYAIEEEIGRGGMGVVYKARHTGLGREVALKTILSGRFASPEDRSRFQAEAIAAAKLSHKGIVPIFEIGEAAGQPFFAMPLIEGQSLAQRLRVGPLPPLVAARLLRKIAAAVAYAHSCGVIHRDLKPGNILLAPAADANCDLSTSEGLDACEPKITDFGLAKRLGDGAELTMTGQILGTPSYMPPEQASGYRHNAGPAADIYSLGAILYAMLTGQAPFVSDNPVELILHVIEREPLLPRSLVPHLPRAVESICLKCIEKNPKDRYPSATRLADDLDRFLRHEPPLARRPTTMHRLRRWVRRKPVLAAHLIGLAVPLVVGQMIFLAHPARELGYHLRLCGMLALWIAASVVCQWLFEQRRATNWPLYAWAAADTLLLTGTLCQMARPLGLFVGGYLVLVAISALAGKTNLVIFTTLSSMFALLLLFLLRPEEALPLHYALFAQVTIALAGLAVGYQAWRMNVLREYYGER